MEAKLKHERGWPSALLEGLWPGQGGRLLGGLGQVLRDEPALQALEESVSELGCACRVLGVG